MNEKESITNDIKFTLKRYVTIMYCDERVTFKIYEENPSL